MYTKNIRIYGQNMVLACDGLCSKAWGINLRAKVEYDPNDPDDVSWLTDDEVGTAPDDPGTYEGGEAKPSSPTLMNKWCARECERSELFDPGEAIVLPDWSVKQFNQPWKHGLS